jgi:osmotically-inducible protein OsmY
MPSKTDYPLKLDIEQELAWDPTIHAAQIGVSVNSRAVTLSGIVDSYPE